MDISRSHFFRWVCFHQRIHRTKRRNEKGTATSLKFELRDHPRTCWSILSNCLIFAPKKYNWLQRDSNPRPLRCRCITPLTFEPDILFWRSQIMSVSHSLEVSKMSWGAVFERTSKELSSSTAKDEGKGKPLVSHQENRDIIDINRSGRLQGRFADSRWARKHSDYWEI